MNNEIEKAQIEELVLKIKRIITSDSLSEEQKRTFLAEALKIVHPEE